MNLFKKILRITFWTLLVAGLTTVFAFVQKQENELLCNKVRINILKVPMQDFEYLGFVEEDDIRELLAQHFGQIENIPLANIDVHYLERLIYTNPWVERADVYMSINGVIDIEIEQRIPILRIINSAGENYYMDSQGKLMPWSPNFTPRTLIAAGNINEKYHEWCKTNIDQIINNDTLKTSTLLDDLYALTRFILANKFWQAYTEQIFVNEKGDIELVPKVGNHKIIFGNADEIPEKFWKLKVFYKEGLNYTGWENYDTLNLKFKNQVVCTRKIKEIRN